MPMLLDNTKVYDTKETRYNAISMLAFSKIPIEIK